MSKLNIIFFGTPSFVIPVLEKLRENFHVIAVITTQDQPIGRKQTTTPSPIKQYALEHTLHTMTPHKLTKEFVAEIKNLASNIDYSIVAAYGKIIPSEILDIPKFGTLNIHPSHLPKYRGPSPLQYAILNGETETAVSIMKLDAEMDHGPLLKIQPLPITPKDTFETLVTRAFKQGADLLPQVMEEYANGKITAQEQNHLQATYTQRITKEMGYINIYATETKKEPAKAELKREIDYKTRAFYPWPGAWTKVVINNQKKILKFLPEQKLQLEGKKPMAKSDFLNGYPQLRPLLETLI